jgi:hypothetical protein
MCIILQLKVVSWLTQDSSPLLHIHDVSPVSPRINLETASVSRLLAACNISRKSRYSTQGGRGAVFQAGVEFKMQRSVLAVGDTMQYESRACLQERLSLKLGGAESPGLRSAKVGLKPLAGDRPRPRAPWASIQSRPGERARVGGDENPSCHQRYISDREEEMIMYGRPPAEYRPFQRPSERG